MYRFRHKVTGLITRHSDPAWAASRAMYEPVLDEYRSFDDLTKDQLVALAAHRGLPRSGTKEELIERLRA